LGLRLRLSGGEQQQWQNCQGTFVPHAFRHGCDAGRFNWFMPGTRA
jgi:predicted metalloprotease